MKPFQLRKARLSSTGAGNASSPASMAVLEGFGLPHHSALYTSHANCVLAEMFTADRLAPP